MALFKKSFFVVLILICALFSVGCDDNSGSNHSRYSEPRSAFDGPSYCYSRSGTYYSRNYSYSCENLNYVVNQYPTYFVPYTTYCPSGFYPVHFQYGQVCTAQTYYYSWVDYSYTNPMSFYAWWLLIYGL